MGTDKGSAADRQPMIHLTGRQAKVLPACLPWQTDRQASETHVDAKSLGKTSANGGSDKGDVADEHGKRGWKVG